VSMLDYFEMERVIEELAKAYPAQCATTWFKITKNHKPSEEEYRNKVVEYMKIFEYLLATYPPGPDTDKLKEVVKKILAKEIDKVLKGDNKDVEKRHRHYVINSPSLVYSNDTLKNGVSEQQEQLQEQQILEKSIDIITKPSIRKRLKNNKNMTVVALVTEQQSQENQNENENENENEKNNIIIVNRRRKKKLILD
jgi:hypothetical protein